MDLQERIKAFAELGELLRTSLEGKQTRYTEELNLLIENQQIKNPWFTPENVKMAAEAIADELTEDNLVKWTDPYPDLRKEIKPSKIAVIMAGNIPLAGFHDFISVLITGNNIIAKTSSKDDDLIRFTAKIICDLNPGFNDRINFTDGILSGFDAVVATGSDNSSRYFEYYFGKYPHIIRKNRNSVAIITGDETEDKLRALGNDVFSYFGLGCRNVSKIFIPRDYDFSPLIKSWKEFKRLIYHEKYANNYDFNKAVNLVNREKFLDTGFLLIKEDPRLSSPVSVLYFEEYDSEEKLFAYLKKNSGKIQCITGRNYIPFGFAQRPAMWDYADNADTLDFLLKKISVRIL